MPTITLNNMKCPECKKLNQKSVVKQGPTISTAMGNIPFYDEDGNYHSHDRNTHKTKYECTAGHKFEITIRKECWCGWPNNEK